MASDQSMDHFFMKLIIGVDDCKIEKKTFAQAEQEVAKLE